MSVIEELAAAAARLVVEEGMEYGPAKHKAARALLRGQARASELPSNERIEEAVREHLALFHADTQPAELAALRHVALRWMERLAEFRPHLSGAVWRGTATRLSNVHLQLYCDDSKSAEISLLNQNQAYEVASTQGPRGDLVDMLCLTDRAPELGEPALVCLTILDTDDLRGALKPDAQGRTWRGDLKALREQLRTAP
jgi:hypothetical protein